jgi:KDO2-lipid IV(A) lauroyltransferase
MAVGGALGGALRRLSPRRRQVAAVNIELCFPDLSPGQRADLLRRHFHSLGRGIVELGTAWWASDRALAGLVQVEGLEHLRAAHAAGRGVVLLSAHFTTLEIGGRLLARHEPFHVMYRRHEHPVIEWAMRRNRERHFDHAIPRDQVRAMLRSLKAGHAVWYAPDQDYAGKGAVFAPFFGVPASTNGATARIAAVSGAPVVPFFPVRTGAGYRLRILPPLAGYPAGDPAADAARINAVIEAEVRRAPEQYLWVHRRFKHRPPGEVFPYGRGSPGPG